MPEDDYAWLPREDILHFEKSARSSTSSSPRDRQGPLTGGEPLMRRDANLVRMLAARAA
jgi:cyclic pyranopterin phosphate synthase